MTTILHITSDAEWKVALRDGEYVAPSLASEGFIHCSTHSQAAATANVYFRGATDLVLLLIEEAAVTAHVKYEPPVSAARAGSTELFPHIYGPLNLNAVVAVVAFPPDADGSFTLPDNMGSPSARRPA
jgi:uncharacterized protein (DUF952 family)